MKYADDPNSLLAGGILAVFSVLLMVPFMLKDAYAHGVTCGLLGCRVGGMPVPSLYDNAVPILVGSILAWISFGVFVMLLSRFKRKRTLHGII